MMQVKRFFGWLALGILALGITGGGAMADGAVISGTVFFRERIMLPDTAQVSVQLVDISLADAPARVLGEAVAEGASPPYHYQISYDPADIVPGHRYAVSARISDGETLLFISTTNNSVFGDGPDATDILVQRVPDAMSAHSDGGPFGVWLAEDINGAGVIDNLQTVLELGADGHASGTGGCNRFSGSFNRDGAALGFGNLVSTQMACAPAAMEQEGKFFHALSQVASYRLDAERDKLILVDDSGADIVILSGHD